MIPTGNSLIENWECVGKNMANSKTIFLMLGLIFILVLILVLKSVATQNKKPPLETPSPSPAESINITTPSASSSTATTLPSAVTFSILGNSIKNSQLGIVDSFQVFFSDQLGYQDLNYSISPEIRIETSLDKTGKVLTIKPEGIWDFDTEYKLTISRESKSAGGQNLDKDTTITFKTPPYSGI